jgi:lipoate-protein ligase B
MLGVVLSYSCVGATEGWRGMCACLCCKLVDNAPSEFSPSHAKGMSKRQQVHFQCYHHLSALYCGFILLCVAVCMLLSRDATTRSGLDLQRRYLRLRTTLCRSTSHTAVVYDLHDNEVSYQIAWDWQKERAKQVAAGSQPQALVLLQHRPVYTLGTYSSIENLKFDVENSPLPLFRTERGGEVTYHGPGQLVAYPILDLRHHGQDLHEYLRRLEGIIISALREVSGIDAFREEGLTGAKHYPGCALSLASSRGAHVLVVTNRDRSPAFMQGCGLPLVRLPQQASGQHVG